MYIVQNTAVVHPRIFFMRRSECKASFYRVVVALPTDPGDCGTTYSAKGIPLKTPSLAHRDRRSSPIFTHHINYIGKTYYKRRIPYTETEPTQLVVDYIASMTDDYFIDLHAYFFPHSPLKVEYIGYFE